VSWLSEGASVAWKISAKLRGHQDDVNDLAWAHDDGVLLSGGVENECVLFNVEKRSFMVRPPADLLAPCSILDHDTSQHNVLQPGICIAQALFYCVCCK
jgi:WD40 repeat protein